MNKILWGFKTTAILLIIFTLSVMAATIIESRLGTQFAFSVVITHSGSKFSSPFLQLMLRGVCSITTPFH